MMLFKHEKVHLFSESDGDNFFIFPVFITISKLYINFKLIYSQDLVHGFWPTFSWKLIPVSLINGKDSLQFLF